MYLDTGSDNFTLPLSTRVRKAQAISGFVQPWSLHSVLTQKTHRTEVDAPNSFDLNFRRLVREIFVYSFLMWMKDKCSARDLISMIHHKHQQTNTQTLSTPSWCLIPVLNVKLPSLEAFPSPNAITHFPCLNTTCAAPAKAPHFTSAATTSFNCSNGAEAKASASGLDFGRPHSDGAEGVLRLVAGRRATMARDGDFWDEFSRLVLYGALSGAFLGLRMIQW